MFTKLLTWENDGSGKAALQFFGPSVTPMPEAASTAWCSGVPAPWSYSDHEPETGTVVSTGAGTSGTAREMARIRTTTATTTAAKITRPRFPVDSSARESGYQLEEVGRSIGPDCTSLRQSGTEADSSGGIVSGPELSAAAVHTAFLYGGA